MRNKLHYALPPLFAALTAASGQAQHLDVLLQVVDNKIVTGAANYDDNTWLVGQRVFRRQFSSFFGGAVVRTNDPGFTGLQTGSELLVQPGVVGFDPGIDVRLDIVPSSIDGVSANFWYWDGIDPLDDGFTVEDVAFGSAPGDVTWTLVDQNVDLFAADGSDTVVSGALVQRTDGTDGSIHEHLVLEIVGDKPEGVYLASLVARAEGYEDSDPFFFVHRTAGLTNDPRDIAADWVQENFVEELLLGDYTSDGIVDAADYEAWRSSYGETVGDLPADGNADGVVDAADYTVWRDAFEETLASINAASVAASPVPEPAGGSLVAAAIALALGGRWRKGVR